MSRATLICSILLFLFSCDNDQGSPASNHRISDQKPQIKVGQNLTAKLPLLHNAGAIPMQNLFLALHIEGKVPENFLHKYAVYEFAGGTFILFGVNAKDEIVSIGKGPNGKGFETYEIWKERRKLLESVDLSDYESRFGGGEIDINSEIRLSDAVFCLINQDWRRVSISTGDQIVTPEGEVYVHAGLIAPNDDLYWLVGHVDVDSRYKHAVLGEIYHAGKVNEISTDSHGRPILNRRDLEAIDSVSPENGC